MKEVMHILADAKIVCNQGKNNEALLILNEIGEVENSEVLFLKGEIFYKLQRWGDALNCFNRFCRLEPDNPSAKTYIEMIKSILSFYNTDQFNL
jgi:tetratricopeptide (TPR) repeat protein